MGKTSGELDGILSWYCTGEGARRDQGCDVVRGLLGVAEVVREVQKMARAIRWLTDVTAPKQHRLRRGSGFGESLTSTMKIAIVTGMMPTSIQDHV